MADFFTKFCFFIYDLTPDEKAWLQTHIDYEWWEKTKDEGRCFSALIDDKTSSLCIDSVDSDGDIEQAAWLVGEFLRAWRRDQRVVINAAFTSNARVDHGFGGQTVVVTADHVYWFDAKKIAEAWIKDPGSIEPTYTEVTVNAIEAMGMAVGDG